MRIGLVRLLRLISAAGRFDIAPVFGNASAGDNVAKNNGRVFYTRGYPHLSPPLTSLLSYSYIRHTRTYVYVRIRYVPYTYTRSVSCPSYLLNIERIVYVFVLRVWSNSVSTKRTNCPSRILETYSSLSLSLSSCLLSPCTFLYILRKTGTRIYVTGGPITKFKRVTGSFSLGLREVSSRSRLALFHASIYVRVFDSSLPCSYPDRTFVLREHRSPVRSIRGNDVSRAKRTKKLEYVDFSRGHEISYWRLERSMLLTFVQRYSKPFRQQ